VRVYDAQAKIHDVPDPYFEDNFDEVFEIVRAGCAGLLEHITRERGLAR
jgi:protein-tyrosine phosphatase